MGIFFEIEIFVLKYILDHSESIPTKKFDQKFLPSIFSTCGLIFRKNGYVSQNGIFFQVEIFVLKYVLDHFESILTKKNFRPKFFVFAIFSTCDPIFEKNGYVKSKWIFFSKLKFLF